jgi:hypothetical protein
LSPPILSLMSHPSRVCVSLLRVASCSLSAVLSYSGALFSLAFFFVPPIPPSLPSLPAPRLPSVPAHHPVQRRHDMWRLRQRMQAHPRQD